MEYDEVQLLLTDLCCRQPFNVKIAYVGNELINGSLIGITGEQVTMFSSGRTTFNVRDVRPYLRPLSSMTKEEFKSLTETTGLIYDQLELMKFDDCATLEFWLEEIPSYVVIKVFDWLNKNHFDYRGLIERKLAIKVTKDNNPYEN